ncbi:DUF3089 domain-containing protein [Pedomonas mirosovicensis]|uniref:DUF3089 domain-containing protein n=1 Tax=Pedomonas mirosovicensis TaxID=2908641 RepID=UPI00216979A5|nr:DUF3089 domain-containing protein [Pedomonas mirosovicensis]MCH8684897.1 DUF3089 domain-containing protein [Pedomonas mirosovicensis]
MTSPAPTRTAPKRKISPAIKFLWVVAGLVMLVIIGFVGWQAFLPQLMRFTYVPTVSFAESAKDPAPDYTKIAAWAAHPARPGTSQDTPEGFSATTAPVVDVFFVPPTTYMKKERWNAPLDDAATNALTDRMIRHQASVFNNVGHVWAPRYRQATLGAFFTDKSDRVQALKLAYKDVAAAFDAFLASHGDKPFILAAHSQGSLHALALLQHRIAGTPAAQHMVAAYLIGWPISIKADLEPFGLAPCATPAATGCVVSWQSFGEPADPSGVLAAYGAAPGATGIARAGTPMVCTNPLSWWADTRRIEAGANLGALPFVEVGQPMAKVEPGLTGAACDATGILHLTQNPQGSYQRQVMPGENYHVYDYALFWANIRANVQTRVDAFLKPTVGAP